MVSNRDVVRVVLVVVGVGLALYLVWALRQVIGVLVVSTFLALALGPAVYGLERLRVPLVLAILIVYIGIGLAIAGVAVAVVPAVAAQVNGLIDAIPGYLDAARSGDRYGIGQALGRQIDALPSRADEAVGAVQTVTVGVFSGVVQFVTALVVTFLLLLDGRRLAELFFAQLVPARVREARAVAERVYKAVAGYVIGNAAISLLAGLSAYVVLRILDVPFAGALAVVMGLLDLVPIVGASVAGGIIAIFAAIADFPTALIVWAVFFVVYQQVENNVLQPIVYKRTVELSPLAVIVAVLVGGVLFGVVGALIAIPAAAAIEILVETYRPLTPPPEEPPRPPAGGGPELGAA